MSESSKQIMVVAGEASGDAHAGELIAELGRRNAGRRFFGCGGGHMAAAGCELLVSTDELAVMGLFEVVRHLPRLHGHLRRLKGALRARRPAAVILVDFPDFNLRLAAAGHAAGVPVIYFISPQLWAWRSGRVEQIRRHVDRMICIFPFEREFYAGHGVEVAYVGHPLVERVPCGAATRSEDLIALLPGSRKREVAFHLPVMLEAARQLHAEGGARFVLPVAPGLVAEEVGAAIPQEQRGYVELVAGERMHAEVGRARLAIVASGTATVEAALLGTPMVVVYRLSRLSYGLGKRLVRTPHVAMVNLIAGRELVPELIQDEFRPPRVVEQARRLLAEGGERTLQMQGLAEVRERLGAPGAIGRAADEVERVLQRARLY